MDVEKTPDNNTDVQEFSVEDVRKLRDEDEKKKTRLAKFAETMKQRIANRKSRDDKQADQLRDWMDKNR